ncbi:MAG TPA: hypothetical protein VGC82_05860, partial [Rhodopila sp.]
HPQGNQRRSYQQGGDGYQGNDEGQTQAEPEDPDQRPPGLAEQRAPGMGEQPEARDIPIAAAPPEG